MAALELLHGGARIGEEIGKVSKAASRPTKIITAQGKNKSGRKDAMPSGTTRAKPPPEFVDTVTASDTQPEKAE